MNKPRPFNFDEFRAVSPMASDAPKARSYSEEELAVARAEGVVEGRRLAMESIAANEAAQLESISVRLESVHETWKKANCDEQ